jgi:glycosyltransferase involved in cell wall biosynthesis
MATLSANSVRSAAGARLSVIIAVRNGAGYLERCLQALSKSDCDDYEVILVDDASTDSSVAIAEAHGVRVIRMERRAGPGAARNLGAKSATSPILFFVDADVCVHPDAVERVLGCLETEGEIDAVFGCYDDFPGSANLLSQYKNLFHRFVHLSASAEACTFWSGCGAVRKSAFDSVGGFDVRAPSIEDIDLGVRLRKAGSRIRLDKSLEASHLKTWRLMSLVKSDVIDRGIAWTRLILRERNLPTDLNLTVGQRLSAVLACLMLGITLMGSWWHPMLAALPLLAMLVVWSVDRLPARGAMTGRPRHRSPALWIGAVALAAIVFGVLFIAGKWGLAIGAIGLLIAFLNLRFYRFFAAKRGLAFTVLIVPLHLAYFIYSVASLAIGVLLHVLGTDGGADKWRRLGPEVVTGRSPGSPRPLLARMESAHTRRRAYACIMGVLFVLAWVAQGVKSVQNHEPFDFVVSDAEGYWVYLPSVIIDHNLTLTRQIAFHATVHPIDDRAFVQTPRGLQNHWPIGVALTLLPSFAAAHLVSLVLWHWTGVGLFAPTGYSLIYQLFGLLTVILMSWCAMVAIDGVLRRHFRLGGAAIGAGVIACAVGSNWAYYIFREPFMSHALGAAWIILAIASAERVTVAAREQRIVRWHGAALVFTLSMAVACRHTNVVMLPLTIWTIVVVARSGLVVGWLRQLPLLMLAAFPLILHVLTLRLMSARQGPHAGLGGYKGNEVFNWSHPALFSTLFSDLHGLFFWSPVLLPAVSGIAWYFARRGRNVDGLLVSLLISFAALWYLNSAWYGWSFGKAFGARAFLDLIGLFVIGVALAFESLGRDPARWPRIVMIPIAAAILFNWVLLALFVVNKVPREAPLFPSLHGRKG